MKSVGDRVSRYVVPQCPVKGCCSCLVPQCPTLVGLNKIVFIHRNHKAQQISTGNTNVVCLFECFQCLLLAGDFRKAAEVSLPDSLVSW